MYFLVADVTWCYSTCLRCEILSLESSTTYYDTSSNSSNDKDDDDNDNGDDAAAANANIPFTSVHGPYFSTAISDSICSVWFSEQSGKAVFSVLDGWVYLETSSKRSE